MPNDPVPCILLVEDEPLIRMLAVDMLDALGVRRRSRPASGEDEAQVHGRRGAEGSVAALMIDLGLPDLPGEEVVARRLRQRRPDLPVILTTGADATAARARLAGNGPVGVLEKPYQLNDLGAVRSDAARGRPRRSS